MKTLIIYDSVFGNTGKIAEAIHKAVPADKSLAIASVDDASPKWLEDTDLLIIGSPTRGFRPTPAMSDFIRKLPEGCLNGKPAAVFDTRLSLPKIQSSALRFIVKTGGYAARCCLKSLFHAKIAKNTAKCAKGILLRINSLRFLRFFSLRPSRGHFILLRQPLLSSRGAKLIMQPQGFFVSGEEGPLLSGELQRASDWAMTACERLEKLLTEI